MSKFFYLLLSFLAGITAGFLMKLRGNQGVMEVLLVILVMLLVWGIGKGEIKHRAWKELGKEEKMNVFYALGIGLAAFLLPLIIILFCL